MAAPRLLLSLTPIIDPFLDVLNVVYQSRATRLKVSEFVLDPMAAGGSDMLSLAVFGLADLPIDLAEMKISTLTLKSSSKRR